MIYIKWLCLAILDWILLPVWYLTAPIVSLYTTADKAPGWTAFFCPYDNPPAGDERWQREGLFPGHLTGFKGYLNRVGWICRNPGYGFQKWASVPFQHGIHTETCGNLAISDKYRIPGWYFARSSEPDWGDVVAWEFYCVLPYGFKKCLRMRLGWKIMTDKWQRLGFAPLVNTANPLKSYVE